MFGDYSYFHLYSELRDNDIIIIYFTIIFYILLINNTILNVIIIGVSMRVAGWA
jgi:hypothetical protein